MKLLDQVASLYNQELFEEIVFLYEFTNPKSAEITDLSVKNQILLQVYVADAYFESQQYKQSAKFYARVLPLYDRLPKDLAKNFTQTEVRYRYYRTLMRIRHYAEALDVLREVPFQSAPTKIKYALLRLVTVHFGDDRGFDIQEMINNPQSAAFLELLFLQIRQGMTLSQKQQTDLTAKVNFLNNSNMKTWLTLHFEIMNRNHTEGIRQLLNLSPQGYRISLEMAEVYNLMGMKAECHDAIKCAHSSEQDRSERMGLYARVLRQTVTGDVRLNLRIDALASSLKRSDSDCADVWIAYGEFAAAKKDYSKAIHFACKAENMSPDIFTRSLSRQLKAGIFVTMNKFVDAEKILRSAIVEDPKNFQFYEMLVDAIINQKKKHSVTRALNVVDICMERLPDDPQAKTLNAMLKLKTKRRGTKAHDEMIERLEQLNNDYPYIKEIPLALMEEYKKSQQYDKAKEMLKRSSTNWLLPNEAYSQIQEKLAELATTKGDPEEAYDRVLNINDTPNLGDQMNALENRFRTPANPSRRAPRLPRAGRPRGALLQPLPPDSMETP